MTRRALLLLLLIAVPVQAAPGPATPPAQTAAFRLGFALQAPAAQTETYLQAVKGLKDIPDDAQAANEVSKLAAQSADLRAKEARAYAQAALLLHALGASPKLQTWASDTSRRLATPLALSKDAQRDASSDTDTATVMGTIDEAQDIKTAADKWMPSLLNWLKVTLGQPGVWADALGNMTAGLDAAVGSGRSLYLSRSEPMKLADTSPPGTPTAALLALNDLAPPRGNLAPLIQLPPTPISAQELARPRETLLSAYGAKPLAEAIDKG